IMKWVRDGADVDDYKDNGIQKIIETRCVTCHNKDAGSLPDFTKFEVLKSYTTQDQGATFASLTRVSHIHLFGISFIFMFVGLIFSFAETTSTQYKCIAIGMPYAFLIIDILSWWLTKIHPMFAWLVIFAGMGMGISFAFMLVTSILEMWLFKPVFINGFGAGYLQRRDSTDASIADRAWEVMKAVARSIKPAAAFAVDMWLTHGLPLIKGLLASITKK
ncbi:MAG: hypothetical protein Q8Q54_18810, partial [Methylococcales bacterium]|nr:hypothetical protein [Methylococcales bacterium]